MKTSSNYFNFLFLILVGLLSSPIGNAQTLSIPTLGYPNFSIGINVNPINLNWYLGTVLPAQTTYHLQVSYSPIFADLLLDTAKLSVTEYDRFVLHKGQTYYWRVRLEDLENDYSNWATGWFTSSSTIPLPTATITIGNASSSLGGMFTVPVKMNLNENGGAKAYSGNIVYNNFNFIFIQASVPSGTIISNNSMEFSCSNNISTGIITFLAVGLSPVRDSTNGTLFYLTFNVIGPVSASPDTIVPAQFTGCTAGFSYVNSKITWTKTSNVSGLGDADGNSIVDINDAILVMEDMLGVGSISDTVDTKHLIPSASYGFYPTGAVIKNMQNRINANVDTNSYNKTGWQVLDLNDVTDILDIIQGKTSFTNPSTSSATLQIAEPQYTENNKLTLPISFTNTSNMLNAEIIFKYDSVKIKYQTFASLVIASGYFLNAQELQPGETKFSFASPDIVGDSLSLANLVFNLVNGSIPVGSVIETEYKVNGGSWQMGPSISLGITGADNQRNIIPVKFSISQNYPNPFNPSTIIDYALPKSSLVSIKIYNILGQEVKTLVNKDMQPGNYSVQWNGDNNLGQHVSSGAYIYRVVAGQNVKTMKMILLK